MKKIFLTFACLLALNAAFAGTCTREGNGWRAKATCDCTDAQACYYAQKAIDALA